MQADNRSRKTANPRIFNRIFDRLNLPSFVAGSLLLSAATLGCGLQSAQAEGSKDFTNYGGDRPYLEFRNDATIGTGILRQTIIKVFANTGEFINLGSSAVGVGLGNIGYTRFDSTTEATSGIINYRRPDGTVGTCGAAGLIADQTQEAAGPGVAGGFTPCVFTATQTGIYEIEFVSPNPTNTSTNPPPLAATAAWAEDPLSAWVTAWDATVSTGAGLGAGGTAVLGRVYANYFALNLGANNRSLNSRAFVQTLEGFQYQISLNGIDPFGFIFFANREGFKQVSGAQTGQPSYRSQPFPITSPTALQNPGAADGFATDDVTYKLFINQPNPSLPTSANSASGSTWLLNPALPTPGVSGLTFTGSEGTVNQLGGSPLGGNFSFNATVAGSYSLVLDIDQNGVFGDNNDRVILGTATTGNNTVPWDGLDGNGAAVTGNLTYKTRISINVGETHFPFLDVENGGATGGITVSRLNGPPCPATNPTCLTRVFYDDRPVSGLGIARLPNPGAPSHSYPDEPANGGFGNNRGIDTWINVASDPSAAEASIFVRRADLKVTKVFSPANPVPGGPITYTITVRNAGPSDVVQVGVNDTVPADITNVTWTCAITTGNGSCANSSGVGNSINTNVSFLSNGAIATYTVQGQIRPTATGNLSNTVTITRPPDVNDPVDDDNSGGTNTTETASANFTLGPPRPVIGLAKQAGTPVDNGNGTFTIPYTFRINNLGGFDLSNVQVSENLTNVYTPSSFTIAAPPTSTGITANPSFTGTGANVNLLAAGQTLAIGATATVTINVIVTPNNYFGTYLNQAEATATDPSGNAVPPDQSNNGANSDPDNDGDPTNNNDRTPVTLPNSNTLPKLGVAKQVGTPTVNDDGSYTVAYTILVKNFGTVTANNVQLTENLFGSPSSTFFGATSAVVSAAPTIVSGALTAANPSFNGNSNQNLLTGTETLGPGQAATLTFSVRVVPGSVTEFDNTVTATGVGPNGQALPPQRSVDQTGIANPNPDLNGDGDPSNDVNDRTSRTPITFGPRFRLLKRITSATRNGAAISGVNFGGVVTDAEGLATAISAAGLPPIGVLAIPPATPLASGDEVEYTIYFLSDGGTPAIDTNLCDPVPLQASLIADSNRLKLGSANPVRGGSIFSPIAPLPANNSCPDQSNPTGSVIFGLGNVSNLRGNNTGFVRFRVRIN